MANEWTAKDVYRVMKEEAKPDGSVRLFNVKRRFNLSGKKEALFDGAVAWLVDEGLYRPTSRSEGYVSNR
jgi:hypothetical protein